jgi:LacI family transcriptional regulator
LSRTTMAELAKLAGIDVSTVSRALRGDRSRVASATIEMVQQLAAAHGFQPDPVAAALRSGRSKVLGVLVPTMSDVAVAQMLEGIAQQALARGYLALTTPTGTGRRTRENTVASLLRQRVDGVIVADSTVRSGAPKPLVESATPYVFALRGVSRQLGVVADDALGGRLVAAHLLQQGHRDIAVVAGPTNAATSRQRLAGFRAAAKRAGIDLGTDRVVHSEWGVREGHAAMAQLLISGNQPTAVFALNDYNAIGASRALQDVGLEVGRDVALVGYNDISISAELPVPLSSVHNNLELVGRLAVDALLALIGGGEPASQTVAPSLVVRESSRVQAAQRLQAED